MVLYCLENVCTLYYQLVHRMIENRDKEAVVYCAMNCKVYDILVKLKEHTIFKDVVKCNMFYRKQRNTESDIVQFYNQMFNECGYPLDSFEDIYVFTDNWESGMGIYFNLINRQYTWVEFVKNYPHCQPANDLEPEFRKLIQRYNTLSPMANCAKAYILAESDKTKAELEKVNKDFSIWNCEKDCEQLSLEQLQVLAECYDMDISQKMLDSISDSTLMIKNSYGYSLRSIFEQLPKRIQIMHGFDNNMDFKVSPYAKISTIFDKIIMDFFCPDSNKYYIKLHPNEAVLSVQEVHSMYGNKCFPFSNMPFEFVGRLFKKLGVKFDKIVTPLHAIDVFDYNTSLIMGYEYFKTWFFYCSIYITLCYAEKSGFKTIYCDKDMLSQVKLLTNITGYSPAVKEIDYYDVSQIKRVKSSALIFNAYRDWYKTNMSFLHAVDSSNVVCFLNMEYIEEFFEQGLYPYFVPVCIKKDKINEYCFNMQCDETIWIYSTNQNYRFEAMNFSHDRIMYHSGYRMHVEEISCSQAVDLFFQRCYKASIQRISDLTNRMNNIIDMAVEFDNATVLKNVLKTENSFGRYIDLLDKIKDKYLIMVAVKDTPGDNIPNCVIEHIHDIGFSKFTKEGWKCYAGVIYKEKVILDQCGQLREESVEWNYSNELLNVDISISSMAWKQGNLAKIVLNGRDYAVNLRGLNIVVYDVDNNKLIDSVVFDYHRKELCQHLPE